MIRLTVGDWSKDGHGMTSSFNVDTDMTTAEFLECYKRGVELVGFDLTEFCDEYEDCTLSVRHIKTLEGFGCKVAVDDYDPEEKDIDLDDDVSLCDESYAELYVFIANLGSPLPLTIVTDDNEVSIGGYGLYH
jgi:hypothetical protein